jgi:hypothetical protein
MDRPPSRGRIDHDQTSLLMLVLLLFVDVQMDRQLAADIKAASCNQVGLVQAENESRSCRRAEPTDER